MTDATCQASRSADRLDRLLDRKPLVLAEIGPCLLKISLNLLENDVPLQGGFVASNTFPQTMPGISAVPRERRRSKGSACKPSMMKTSLARPNTKTARRAFATPRKSRCKMMSGRATDAMKAPSCSGSRTVSTLATTRWRPRVRVFSKIRAKDRDAISSATMCELGYAERAARARLGLD